MYSASLLVAKSKVQCSVEEATSSDSLLSVVKSKNNFLISPPLNAKVKDKDENYNDFYENNIEFYKEHMKKHYGYTIPFPTPQPPPKKRQDETETVSPLNNHHNLDITNPFLGLRRGTKIRLKQQI